MRTAILAVLANAMLLTGLSLAEEKKIPDREELEKAFVERMSNAALVGRFSIEGRDGEKPERYEIDSVKKHQGDDWVITARIKYGDKDVKLPIVVQVYWAGDTPVISLTDLTIPGLGTFTSRVMIYGDRYAGTWQHGDVGGQLWGKVESSKPSDGEKAPSSK